MNRMILKFTWNNTQEQPRNLYKLKRRNGRGFASPNIGKFDKGTIDTLMIYWHGDQQQQQKQTTKPKIMQHNTDFRNKYNIFEYFVYYVNNILMMAYLRNDYPQKNKIMSLFHSMFKPKL